MATLFKESRRRTITVGSVVTYVVLLLGAVISLFPFYWMVSGSLKPRPILFRFPPTLVPTEFTFDAYRYLWDTMDVTRALMNSIVVASLHVGLNVFFSALVAYALAKMKVPGKRYFLWIVLALAMIPSQILLIPLFLEIHRMGLLDSYAGMVLPGAVSSFTIFLLYQAFKAIPGDYIDAALIDGASHFSILMKIVVPMSIPMILTTCLINFHFSWNGFLWPFIVIQSDRMATLPVALALYHGTIGTNPRWDAILAGATVTTIPIVAIYLVIQRKFVESLTFTGLKG